MGLPVLSMIDRGQCKSNFEAFLTEHGVYVPGSFRKGHNIITEFGREWLSQLTAWEVLGDPADDSPWTQHRLRWIGVGDDWYPEIKHVTALKAPVIVTGGNYIATLSAPAWVLGSSGSSSALKYTHAFGSGELPDAVDVTEAGLFVDRNDSGTYLDPTLPAGDGSHGAHIPVAYKVVDPPLTKALAQTLTIRWELRF